MFKKSDVVGLDQRVAGVYHRENSNPIPTAYEAGQDLVLVPDLSFRDGTCDQKQD